MKVFHVGAANYAGDLTGKGAELFGGRWNAKGVSCMYVSASLSLGVLEYAVNNSLWDIPRALSYTIYEIPDKGFMTFPVSSLPGNWMERPVPGSTMAFGAEFLKKNKHLIARVPSVVVPEEFNFLINPKHPDIKKIRVLAMKDFVFDIRMKQ